MRDDIGSLLITVSDRGRDLRKALPYTCEPGRNEKAA
jgi:hypothetical protein